MSRDVNCIKNDRGKTSAQIVEVLRTFRVDLIGICDLVDRPADTGEGSIHEIIDEGVDGSVG